MVSFFVGLYAPVGPCGEVVLEVAAPAPDRGPIAGGIVHGILRISPDVPLFLKASALATEIRPSGILQSIP